MHWMKEQAVRLISFVVREPATFIQYVLLAAIALVMFTLVMQYKIQKSMKKQEKNSRRAVIRLPKAQNSTQDGLTFVNIRKQKEKILRKLHGSRKKAGEESEPLLALEKDKNE
ncbi:hypothetical protein Q1695_013130 [Nippostrongylus brasiliensis]|nr:hypothetical protein Q1695_013130 [Nippostrongylus brasiliensis]